MPDENTQTDEDPSELEKHRNLMSALLKVPKSEMDERLREKKADNA